jgi:hypothetical protein
MTKPAHSLYWFFAAAVLTVILLFALPADARADCCREPDFAVWHGVQYVNVAGKWMISPVQPRSHAAHLYYRNRHHCCVRHCME